MNNAYLWSAVLVAAGVTALIRFLPFWVFRGGRTVPPIVEKLGRVLPYAIMGMLVVYCLKDIALLENPYGLPELIACVVVAALHAWKRNSLLSIGGGTVCYMLLVQFIF